MIFSESGDVLVVEDGRALGACGVPAFRETQYEKEPDGTPRLLPFPEDRRPLPGELGERAGGDGRLGDDRCQLLPGDLLLLDLSQRGRKR